MPAWLTTPDLDVALAPQDYDAAASPNWDDSSGNGNDVTRAGSGPLNQPSGTIGLGNQPTVQVAGGGNDYFENASAGNYQGEAELTIIVVIEADRVQAASSAAFIVGRDGTGDRGWGLYLDQLERRLVFEVSTGTTTTANIKGVGARAPLMPMVVSARYNGGTGELKLWVNGVDDGGSISGSVPATIANDGPALRIFNANFADTKFNGHAGHILIFTRALSDAEREAIEDELIALHSLYRITLQGFSPDLNAHQGVATDGTDFWTTDTGTLSKRNSSWTATVTNSSPFSGLTNPPNHLSDIFYHNGLIYASCENFPDIGATEYIAVYDADTLALVDSVDVNAQGVNFAPVGLALDTNNDIIYGARHEVGSGLLYLDKWDLNTLAYLGRLDLTFSYMFAQLQGITYKDGRMWVSFGGESTTNHLLGVIDLSTGVIRPVYRRYCNNCTTEGLDFTTDDLLWLIDFGNNEFVGTFTVEGDGLVDGDPVLRIQSIASDGATFSIQSDTDFLETHYQVAAAADTSFASPLLDVQDATAGRFLRQWTGGSASTPYLVRARVRTALGWQSFVTALPFTTLAASGSGSTPGTASPPAFQLLDPEFGEPVTGTGVPLVWSDIVPGRTVTLIEYAAALGPRSGWTWAMLTTGALTSPTTFNATALGTGFYALRFTLSDGTQVEFPGFRVGTATAWYPQGGNAAGAGWQKALDTSAQWASSGGTFGAIGGHDHAALCPTNLSPDPTADQVVITGTFSLATGPVNGPLKSELWPFEFAAGGIGGLISGTKTGGDQIAVFCLLKTQLSSHYFGSSACEQIGLAFPPASFEVHIIDEANGVFEVFTTPVDLIVSSWRFLGHCARRDIKYYATFVVTKPGSPSNRMDVLARVFGPEGFMAEIEETVDVTGTGATPVDLVCGYPGFVSWHTPNSSASNDGGFREFWSMGVDYLATTCDPPPTLINPDDLTPLASVECDIVTLTIPAFFDTSDVVSALWEITDISGSFSSPITPEAVLLDSITAYVAQLLPGSYMARVTLTFSDSSTLVSEVVLFDIADNSPPSAPFWIQPAHNSTFTDVDEITLEIGPATDIDSDTLQYGVNWSNDGGVTQHVLVPLGGIVPDTPLDVDITALPLGTIQLLAYACDPCECGIPAVICIILRGAVCPPDVIHVTTVERVESWNDVLRNGGELKRFVPDVMDVEDHREISGEDRSFLSLPRSSARLTRAQAFDHLGLKTVTRTYYRPAGPGQPQSYEDWRIARIIDQRDDRNALTRLIEMDAIWYDTGYRQILQVQATGRVDHDFPLTLTAANHIAFILGRAQPYFVQGSDLSNGETFEVQYSFDSVLSGLQKVAAAARAAGFPRRGMEIEFRRACDLWRVDLVRFIGASNQPPTAVLDWSASDLDVFFDSGGSFDTDGSIVSRTLDPGDGSGVVTLAGETHSHVYAMAGTYNAVLTVTDDDGDTGTVTVPVTVSDAPVPPGDEATFLPGEVYGAPYGE